MESFDRNDYGRPTSAYVRRRLAEITLSQDLGDGSVWRQLEPDAPAVVSLARGAESLHSVLLGNALDHVDQYLDRDTSLLAIGESLEAQIFGSGADRPSRSLPSVHESIEDSEGVSRIIEDASRTTVEVREDRQTAEMSSAISPEQRATIRYLDGDAFKTLSNVDVKGIVKRCPVLGVALEDSRSGPQLFLETLSSRTADPFVRFLNTGSYAEPSQENDSGEGLFPGSLNVGSFLPVSKQNTKYEDVPTSVLLHCEMWRLGDMYDLTEMKSQAYVNILRQCEFGCSSPDKPIDLCAAIRFVYEHLGKQEQLIDAIVNYCVSCFASHRLAEDAEFKQLAYDLRPFHQALCKNCMDRGFENETSAAIIQMPFAPHRPETYASTEHRRSFDDVIYQFHALDEVETPRKRKRPDTDLVLPMRRAPGAWPEDKVKREVKAEPESDENDGLIKSKRRASGASSVADSATIDSEEHFEEINLGPASNPAVESDSDASDWVDVARETRTNSSTDLSRLAFCPKQRSTAEKEARDESDSDSSWCEIDAMNGV